MAEINKVSRRGFLGGSWREKSLAIRPPWAIEEQAFIDACDTCGKCITACPENILVVGSGRLPRVDFTQGECVFCQACLDVCPTNALQAAEQPWHYVAEVSESCLSARGVMCRACGDICEVGAIRFKLAVGGFSSPEISQIDCTACGACLSVCPVKALDIVSS